MVRAVQPVLLELDRDMEEAAASLGAGPLTTFRRIILPNLRPAILAGIALAFARAIGEFGSLVLISGNIPFKTEVASVFIFGQIESDNADGAAAVRSCCWRSRWWSCSLIGRLHALEPPPWRLRRDVGAARLRALRRPSALRLPGSCCSLLIPGGHDLLPGLRGRVRPRLGSR